MLMLPQIAVVFIAAVAAVFMTVVVIMIMAAAVIMTVVMVMVMFVFVNVFAHCLSIPLLFIHMVERNVEDIPDVIICQRVV